MPEIVLHPALVHFPIALILVATVAEAGRILLDKPGAQTVRFLLWACLCGIIAAYWTGHETFEELGSVSDELLLNNIGRHENLAKTLLWIFPITLLCFELSIRAPRVSWIRWVFRFLLGISAVFVVLTGYNGGRLVYEDGLGTQFWKQRSSSQSSQKQAPEHPTITQ